MAIFEYKALSSEGRTIKGSVDADSAKAARIQLKRKGIFPTTLVEGKAKAEKKASSGWNPNIDFERKRVNINELAVATRQLSTLVAAGMPAVEALRALSEQTDHKHFRRVIVDVSTQINEGSTFANALRHYPKIFPKLFSNMIAAGEASGTLGVVLERLADLLEAQAELKRKVVSAMTYPVLMLLFCFGIIILLLAYVVPQITGIFAEQGGTLPLPTQIVMGISDFIRANWLWGVLAVVGLYFGFRKYIATPKGRIVFDGIKLKIPMFGNLALKIAASRFSRNLGTMLSSGVEMLGALGIARNIIGNVVLEKVIRDAAEGVREGKSLSAELAKSQSFPKLLIHMSAIGEKTGQLDTLLLRAADNFDSEVDAFISGLTSILEPVLIIFLAIIVGGILISVMLPMLEMTSLVGG